MSPPPISKCYFNKRIASGQLTSGKVTMKVKDTPLYGNIILVCANMQIHCREIATTIATQRVSQHVDRTNFHFLWRSLDNWLSCQTSNAKIAGMAQIINTVRIICCFLQHKNSPLCLVLVVRGNRTTSKLITFVTIQLF